MRKFHSIAALCGDGLRPELPTSPESASALTIIANVYSNAVAEIDALEAAKSPNHRRQSAIEACSADVKRDAVERNLTKYRGLLASASSDRTKKNASRS
jgi:hypothetical protein